MKPAKTILIEWDRHRTLNERQMEVIVMAMEEYALQFKDKTEVKNLAQPDVSGNGVHPKNKRAHVQAVCEHEFYLKSEKKGYYCKKCKISIDDLV